MATTPNMMSDLSTLTRVPNKILDALTDKLNLCIGSAIHDAKVAGEQAISLNIGIGNLSINLEDMQCKFIPSKDLRQAIKTALVDGVDPLEISLEQALIDKLTNICAEVI